MLDSGFCVKIKFIFCWILFVDLLKSLNRDHRCLNRECRGRSDRGGEPSRGGSRQDAREPDSEPSSRGGGGGGGGSRWEALAEDRRDDRRDDRRGGGGGEAGGAGREGIAAAVVDPEAGVAARIAKATIAVGVG